MFRPQQGSAGSPSNPPHPETIPTVAQFQTAAGTDAFPTTRIQKHDDEVSIRTTKTIPVSRIR